MKSIHCLPKLEISSWLLNKNPGIKSLIKLGLVFYKCLLDDDTFWN